MWPDDGEHASSSLDTTYVIHSSSAPADVDASDNTSDDMDFEASVLAWSRSEYLVSNPSTSERTTVRTTNHMSNFRPSRHDMRQVHPDSPSSRNISNGRETMTSRSYRKYNRDRWTVQDGEPLRKEKTATNNKSQRLHSNSYQPHHSHRSRHAPTKMRYRTQRRKTSNQLSVNSETRRTAGGYKIRRRINYTPRPELYWAPRTMANRLIHRARVKPAIDERLWQCLNCGMLPKLPVSGKCGHTRCLSCIQNCGLCPCGADFPWTPNVNVIVQHLIEKLLATDTSLRSCVPLLEKQEFNSARNDAQNEKSSTPTVHDQAQNTELKTEEAAGEICRIPISPATRFKYAYNLIRAGDRPQDSIPHLAQVAASACTQCSFNASNVLTQAMKIMCQIQKPGQVDQEMNDAVNLQAASSWLKTKDLECILCYDTFSKPVTTPCGHTYCRTCLERSLDYRKTCALCKRSLTNFDLASTCDTEIVITALVSIGELKMSLEPDPYVIPIFACTVAFPGMPCPLFIFERRYWLMIRRVLLSSSRTFGMVPCKKEGGYYDFGTILEIRDCVQLQNGCCILSTIGVSRFRVIQRDFWDGCDMARIQPIVDTVINDDYLLWEIQLIALQISQKTELWMNNMNANTHAQIETYFGRMPCINLEEEWWATADGPKWLWWLLAIIPLQSEIKVLTLATESLQKRMMAVMQTLDIVLHSVINNSSEHVREYRNVLNNNWLQRNF